MPLVYSLSLQPYCFYLAVEHTHGTQRNCFEANGKAKDEDKISLWYLALGGLFLGLGLGVRGYLPGLDTYHGVCCI